MSRLLRKGEPMDTRLREPLVAALLLIAAAVPVSGCGESAGAAPQEEAPPARILHDGGQNRVILTADAARRLGIRIAPVGSRGGHPTIPYSALIYTPDGKTWTYTVARRLLFDRQPIRVLRIAGGVAILSDGPPQGASVVAVGAEELFGSEFEFEEE